MAVSAPRPHAASVLVVDPSAHEYLRRYEEEFPGLAVCIACEPGEVGREIADATVLVGLPPAFNDDLIRRAPRLEWLQLLSTGTDVLRRLPSLAAAVIVTSTQGVHGPPVSEMAFLHMLAVARQYDRVVRNRAQELWEKPPQPLLCGRTIVILGVGTIAAALAKRCKAFEMQVIGVSSTPRPAEGFDRMLSRDRLSEAASLADFLVALVPLTPQTAKIIGASVFAAMKPTAYFINLARGGICDEAALIEALDRRQIAGAGIDAFVAEPLPKGHPFWHREDIVLTPHMGGEAAPYAALVWRILRANMASYLAGRSSEMVNRIAR